ncbi:MAG TPA: STAS domain-containing protein [Thermotogota bacterium]|nr:STAS domain-containing protein [Thermotogota bacterium]HRW92525.1 STAS domain-containing protein [Thermotogota bacterium]
MECSFQWDHEVPEKAQQLTISLKGELVSENALSVREKVQEHMERANALQVVLFDLWNLEYIDSAGLGVFIWLQKIHDEEGLRIQIRGLHDQLEKVFSLTRLGKRFEIVE